MFYILDPFRKVEIYVYLYCWLSLVSQSQTQPTTKAESIVKNMYIGY